ncbi:MAG: hypothetical protein IJQ44_04155 [Bacteroidaceae bacterium]|nr:hypothetical protein [Bacteroidaceae bacterium]
MTKIDNTIITRCQKGDKDAFRSLVETCQGMVFSVALKMLADEEEAKDIVQIKRLFLAGIGKNTYLCIRKRKKSLPIT